MNDAQMAACFGFLSYAVPGCIGVFGVWFLCTINRKR